MCVLRGTHHGRRDPPEARLLGHVPDPSIADGTRWYGHAECVSAAGRDWGAEARAEAEWVPALDELPTTAQELAALL